MTLFSSNRITAIAAIATGLLLPSSVAQEQTAYYDCRTGCSLDANINGPPVCGKDNLTYLNECFAFCQYVAIAQYGPCEEDGSIADENEVEIEDISLEFLTKIIQELPDRYRLVFNLYVMDDYSHKEIAAMLGINIGTSKSNLSRAKMILKEKIEQNTGNKNIPSIQ